jgi:putative addiction module killer protein
MEIRHYISPTGRDLFDEWLSQLGDPRTQAKIAVRIDRLASGNLGDCKPLRDGMWELRINWGPGYRIYYALTGKGSVLLLNGGDKRRQVADIEKALDYLKNYRERTKTK